MTEKQSWLSKLTAGLKKTSQKIGAGVAQIFTHKKLDQDTLMQLEDLLITTDMGLEMAHQTVEKLRKTRFDQEISQGEILAFLKDEIQNELTPFAIPLVVDPKVKPYIIMMVGVNGSGKTTTTAKFAKIFQDQGLQVSIAACDTFRAAAVEQLKVWGERLRIPVIARATGADSAGLAFDALKLARENGDDVLIIDTAGRLHNNSNLMGELEKIKRVLEKLDPTAPHAKILVLDATVGQNAFSQVQLFSKAIDLTGLIVTKLDGSAKGGVVVGLSQKFKLPIHGVGVGEQVDDLKPFSAADFATSLVGLEKERLL